MQHWDLRTLDVQPHYPEILQSTKGEGRSIALLLPAGERLQEHEVHERAWLLVIDGEIEIRPDRGEPTVTGGSGLLAVFDPQERREVVARSDARLLLLLAPWPGPGHPGAREDRGARSRE